MMSDTSDAPANSAGPCAIGAPPAQRAPYTTPKLQQFGALRDVTLGPSGGIGDSGTGSGTHGFTNNRRRSR